MRKPRSPGMPECLPPICRSEMTNSSDDCPPSTSMDSPTQDALRRGDRKMSAHTHMILGRRWLIHRLGWTSVRIDSNTLGKVTLPEGMIAAGSPVCPEIWNAACRSHADPVAPPSVVVNMEALWVSENLHGFSQTNTLSEKLKDLWSPNTANQLNYCVTFL